MRLYPGESYQCGTFALNSVARELGLNHDTRALLSIPSPASGFSMATLAELSSRLGLGLIPVARANVAEVPVPAVVHWRQNHYGAILSRFGQYYKVMDPTFGRPRFMTAEAIASETSGYYLVPVTQVSASDRLAGTTELNLIYGRGNPNWFTDVDDQSCPDCGAGECPVGPGGGDNGGSPGPGEIPINNTCGSGCAGMPVWRVSEPYINLWLKDEPLAYQPALGSRLSFGLSYKQRTETLAGRSPELWFSSVGFSWASPWLSTVNSQYDRYGWAGVEYAGGGTGGFYFGAGLVAGNYYNNLKLAVVTNGLGKATSFELLYPTGAKDVYGFAPTNSDGLADVFFLSAKISSDARYNETFQYEDYDPAVRNIRLKYVVDADGRTNTLS